jgi:hypothetical protein
VAAVRVFLCVSILSLAIAAWIIEQWPVPSVAKMREFAASVKERAPATLQAHGEIDLQDLDVAKALDHALSLLSKTSPERVFELDRPTRVCLLNPRGL